MALEELIRSHLARFSAISSQWDRTALNQAEDQFLKQSGMLLGAIKLQSSIRRNFGLDTYNRRVKPAERGIPPTPNPAINQGQPTLIALSQTIERGRKAYYNALQSTNKGNEITQWLHYFADVILSAQEYSLSLIDFLINKAKLYDRVKNQLNRRQEKVLQRMFREGLDGFKGGLSAVNYISITGASRATATRDLQDLVHKGALLKTGTLKSTRYHLNLGPSFP